MFEQRTLVAFGRSMLATSFRYVRTAWILFSARRWLVSTLGPFVERSRYLENGHESRWTGAYRVGFLSTLITRLTLQRFPSIGGDTLGLVHAETWHRLLPNCPCAIGERTLALSLAEDAEFLEGCEAAVRFEACICAGQDRGIRGALELESLSDDIGTVPTSLTDRWASTWDACLARNDPAIV